MSGFSSEPNFIFTFDFEIEIVDATQETRGIRCGIAIDEPL